MANQAVLCKLVCPGWQRPAQPPKGKDPPRGATRTGMDQGVLQSAPAFSRDEMADGRWQQGTPGGASTG